MTEFASKLTARETQALRLFLERLHSRLPGSVERVMLFGSKARGDSGRHSDIDIIVVLHEKSPARSDAVYDAVLDVLLERGVYLSVLTYDSAAFQLLSLQQTPFMQNLAEEGIILWLSSGERVLQPTV